MGLLRLIAIAAGVTLAGLPLAGRAAVVVDPHAEVAAAIFAASATQAAEVGTADVQIRADRAQIDKLMATIKAGAAQRTLLVAARDRYVAETVDP